MTWSAPSPDESMKATIYCLVLSEIQGKEKLLHTYLTHVLQKQPTSATLILDICCHFLSLADPEFVTLEDSLCDVLRLVGKSPNTNEPLSTFLQNEQVSNEVLIKTIRSKFPRAEISLREALAKDTLTLIKVEEFWRVEKFTPLVKNVARFENLDASFVSCVFDILHSYNDIAHHYKEYYEKSIKLVGLAKVWLHQEHPRLVQRKKLILNQLYQRILEKRSNCVMSCVLNLVEVEILNALLTPVPIELVPSLVRELIGWAKLWYFNCAQLLPPIIKLLNRLTNEGQEEVYNQIALENCDNMLQLVKLQSFKPLISIICHFYKNSSCPDKILPQTSENLINVLASWQNDKEESLTSNLTKALDVITVKYPEHRNIFIRILRECSTQFYDPNANFTVNESPKGMMNTGNTCYANSVIQCLFYTTEFRNKVLQQKPKGSQTLLINLQQIFALLKFSSATVIYPDESFHAALRPSYFVRGQQEDGFLYLTHILDMLKEQELKALGLKDDEMEVKKEVSPATKEVFNPEPKVFLTEDQIEQELNANEDVEMPSPKEMKGCDVHSCIVVKNEKRDELEFCANSETTNNNIPDSLDPVGEEEAALAYHTLSQEVFGGYQVETYSCHGCRFKYKQTKRTTAICLAIPDKENHKSTISELLEAYFQPIELQDSERYECRNCKAKVDTTCFTELVATPNCLVLCLKRFFYDKAQQRTLKINTDVHIEEEIRVEGSDFRIYATVVHSGASASHGHYYVLVNTENGLMKLDDAYVLSNANSMGPVDTPYILFYQRKDCRVDEQDIEFEQLDASLKTFVKAHRGRTYNGLTASTFKRPQPPPPPPPSSSCGGGSGLSSSRMVF